MTEPAIREWTFEDDTRARLRENEGPWQSEPDKIQWVDPETDFDCLMVRNRFGAWCGYVGVTEGHPWFEKDYDDVDADAHGGLTFAGLCVEDAAIERHVCHVPFPGRPARVWWLGFDCGHAFDYMPAMPLEFMFHGERAVYRDRAYVENEVADLAAQAGAA